MQNEAAEGTKPARKLPLRLFLSFEDADFERVFLADFQKDIARWNDENSDS